ncbi:MAG: hypothetical protein HY700_00345, partial [Gemmatimonadetes bacterium]|nr:hypothetical protein [Gemmatimonadota bacterium]
DRDFVRVLLAEGRIRPATLLRRVAALNLPAHDRKRLRDWVKLTADALPTKTRPQTRKKRK